MSGAKEAASYLKDFSEVKAAEAKWIDERRRAVEENDEEAPVVGLAFSGGGIRSASFNMGVLQALSKAGLLSKVDYLSSVSGGGYIASCYSWVMSQFVRREKKPLKGKYDIGDVSLWGSHGTLLDWLRVHGNYLISGHGFSGWTLAGAILGGTLLNLTVLVPMFLLLVGAATYNWLPMEWPNWLHLPGAANILGHDGFIVLLGLGMLALLLYILTTLLFAISTVIPIWKRLTSRNRFFQLMGSFLALGTGLIAIGLLPLFAGFEDAMVAHFKRDDVRGLAHHFSYLMPALSGLLSLWLAVRRDHCASKRSQWMSVVGLSLLVYGLLMLFYHVVTDTQLLTNVGFYYWLALSAVLALSCDINGISMHHYYRSRLAQAYLPPLTPPYRRASDSLYFTLADIGPDSGAPLQLINTTMNTTSSNDASLRQRSGESLVLSPLFCGSTSTGYRHTQEYLDGQLSLSTSFAVSGAAVDPNTYATKSRAMSFLMAFLNIRLGYWTKNPNQPQSNTLSINWYVLMLREMLGIGLSAKNRHIHLADGGHFDNLGLYELLRRQCPYIIVSDAGNDPDLTLISLGQALQRARADFRVEINWLETCENDKAISLEQTLQKMGYALGEVIYDDKSKGKILYLKSMISENITSRLSVDVKAYANTHCEFPNQAISDQFYDEMQFDSYRELGMQLMNVVIENAGDDSIYGLFQQAMLGEKEFSKKAKREPTAVEVEFQ